jgi:hypothetical protein
VISDVTIRISPPYCLAPLCLVLDDAEDGLSDMDNDAPENWTNHFDVARQAQQATGQQQNQ